MAPKTGCAEALTDLVRSTGDVAGYFLPRNDRGQQGWAPMLQEIGHILGTTFPRESGRAGSLGSSARSELNLDWHSIMSPYGSVQWDVAALDLSIPMPAGVTMLQYLRNALTNAGNSSHLLAETPGYRITWDASGIDVVDASGAGTAWIIELPSLQLSPSVGVKVGGAAPITDLNREEPPTTLVWLIGEIENARGSSFGDVIRGNHLGNSLTGLDGEDALFGGAGADTISGGAGSDLIDGGPDADVARFTGSRSDYLVARSGDSYVVTDLVADRDGIDLLTGIEFFHFGGVTFDTDDVVANQDTIYRFFNSATGAHFYTSSLSERDAIRDAIPSFDYEGEAFSAPLGAPGSVPIYRFYNTITQTQFVTGSEAERQAILSALPQFREEGIAYWAFASGGEGTQAVHRFYNMERGTHFLTASEAEKAAVVDHLPQLAYEGVAFWVYS